MTRRRYPAGRLTLSATTVALLSACASTPFSSSQTNGVVLNPTEQRVPLRNWTGTDALLACVGDRMRESRVVPLLVGYGVADTSGKTGVDQAMITRSALNKIARRGSGLRTTSMGVAPTESKGGLALTAEEKARAFKGPSAPSLTDPDWIIEGGVSSVVAGTIFEQKSGGLSARDVQAGVSRSRSADTVHVSYFIKRHAGGVDIPGAHVDLKVVYQQGSASTELGGYVAYRQNDQRHGGGIRLGNSNGFTESPEDALRVAVESALAMLFADQFGIDLSTCPAQPAPADSREARANQAPAVNQSAAYFEAMEPRDRIRFAQSALTARHYDPGPVDGAMGQQTRAAIARFERDAGMPPSGGRITIALLVALAQERAVDGEDLRNPPAGKATPDAVHITLNVPYGNYVVGQRLRAQVVPPMAGHLLCYLNSPDEGLVNLYPLVSGRAAYVGARTAVQLPSATEGRGHPAVTISAPGKHALYCAQTRVDVSAALPPSMRPSGDARGLTLADLQAAIRRAAGSAWIADGVSVFQAVPQS